MDAVEPGRHKGGHHRFRLRDGTKPVAAIDVKTGKPVAITRDAKGPRIAGLTFGPRETRMFFTPRKAVVSAGMDWFSLQRNWWRGTTAPTRRLPESPPHSTLDLTDQWAMKLLDEKDTADQTSLAAPALDDTGWPRHSLDVWAVPEEFPTRHALFRKTFTVPRAWQDGEIALWLRVGSL